MSDELIELKKISKILILANAEAIERELSSYATTDERKMVWVLMDGQRKSKELAQSVGISERAVNLFLMALEASELIENPWGKGPRRLLNYVPPSWVELVIREPKEEEEQKEEGE